MQKCKRISIAYSRKMNRKTVFLTYSICLVINNSKITLIIEFRFFIITEDQLIKHF